MRKFYKFICQQISSQQTREMNESTLPLEEEKKL